jgi:alginate O-acetyltransferase complex protein AlgI
VYFQSLPFLCVFLPVVFLAYLAFRGPRLKNALLIAASLLFYAYGEPIYVTLLLASSLANWGFGLALNRAATGRRALVVVAVAVNLGSLAVFKYAGMAAATVGLFIGADLPFRGLLFPVGISFYTFQALSYVIDVYRGATPAQRSFPRLLLFISFFPQLMAGPIIKYHDVAPQLAVRTVTVAGVAVGLRRFAVGLAKKVLIADTLGVVADSVYAAPQNEVNAAVAWIGALAYLGQVYFDFSGYSDMAIGLARMFGFHYRENFDHPYVARSIRDFWHRWHISLSTWFRDYLYVPLGGNRHGRGRAVANKFIVFALCGLWHGPDWTFVAWGLYHGCFLLLEEYVPLRKLPAALGHLYALLVVTVGFVLFRSKSFGQAIFMIEQMFTGFGGEPLAVARSVWLLDPLNIVVFIAAIIAATPIARAVASRLKAQTEGVRGLARTTSYGGAFVLIVLSLLAVASGGLNPFIYFTF